MSADLASLSTTVENVSAVCLWVAVAVRAPSALRSPRQHALWFAVASAAAAMTLSLDPVSRAILAVTGPTQLVGLGQHLLGVLSVGTTLDFATAAVDRRRHRARVYLGTLLVTAVLVVLQLRAGSGPPPTAFWLVLTTAHLFANYACMRMCWHYSRQSAPGQLRTGLQLFGLGTTCAGLFWCGKGLQLLVDGPVWAVLLPLLMALHAFFRAAALIVPVAAAARRAAADIATVWKLWPLWRDLTETVPNVVLARRRPRLVEILRPHGSWKLLAYRKVVEIRDAVLTLHYHNPPGTADLARDYLAAFDVSGRYSEAMVMACVVRGARDAKLAEHPPVRHPESMADFSGDDLAADASFLTEVARAYGSPAVQAFGTDTARARRARTAA
ncbi:MAB_1171c family putative transporter [Kitasatospora sp. NPDC052896]|uniref:MAB_1171c family putative transporter n=1 Tax=Kitasatospora sp. NPDC052896 TaxID=3364061 RepID=UPI0037C53E7E